jgi:hypothetical protein
MECLHYKPVSNHFCSGGEGGGVKSVSRGDCEGGEKTFVLIITSKNSATVADCGAVQLRQIKGAKQRRSKGEKIQNIFL